MASPRPASPGPELVLRFAPFGKKFAGLDADAASTEVLPFSPASLAVDLGAECFTPTPRGPRMIFDHHFPAPAPERHPSATAAVFMHARDILEWRNRLLASDPAPRFEIIAHSAPDFDALAAAYLVRSILRESWPEASEYEELRSRYLFSVDRSIPGGAPAYRPDAWFRQDLPLEGELAWAFKLAAYASRVDNCRRIALRRERRPHSVLYAALARGRDYREDGLALFFDELRAALSAGRSPLFDDCFGAGSSFGLELAFLDESAEAYARDLVRARRTIVSVPFAAAEYRQRLETGLTAEAFLETGPEGEPRPRPSQLEAAGAIQRRDSLDALFIRDPECLLFKEWAREDRENSSMGRGFLFTAVALSGQREGRPNNSEYYFSLDPERAAGYHLYPLWAALEAAEIAALRSRPEGAVPPSDPPARPLPRAIFAARAGDHPEYFTAGRVWYDGSDPYHFTIVENGSDGTLLREGRADDLSDDEAASIAARVLEYGFFASDGDGSIPATLLDCVAQAADSQNNAAPAPAPALATPRRIDLREAQRSAREHPPSPEAYRLLWVRLAPCEDPILAGAACEEGFLAAGATRVRAESVGRILWPFIDPSGSGLPPRDFLEGHLVHERGRVAAWSRYGIVLAFEDDAAQAAFLASLREAFELLARIRSELPALREAVARLVRGGRTGGSGAQDALGRCRRLAAEVARLELAASRPDGVLLRRFLAATNLEAVIAASSELSEQIHAAQEAQRDSVLQNVLAWGSALGLAMAWFQVDGTIKEALGLSLPPWTVLLIGGGIAAAFMGVYFQFASGRKRRNSDSAARRARQRD